MSAVQSRPTARFNNQFPPGCFSKNGPRSYATSRNTVHFTFCHFSSFHGSSIPGAAASGRGNLSASRLASREILFSLSSPSTLLSTTAAFPSLSIDLGTIAYLPDRARRASAAVVARVVVVVVARRRR